VVQGFFSAVLGSPLRVFLSSAALSQVISNVPAAVLLAGFTSNYRELLYGVSAGGLGTLIASLASLISYKLYRCEFPSKKYLRWFYGLNFIFLIILTAGLLLLAEVGV
jgi:Na+/H+ antiporter NhaD/arsenite permease-like protein